VEVTTLRPFTERSFLYIARSCFQGVHTEGDRSRRRAMSRVTLQPLNLIIWGWLGFRLHSIQRRIIVGASGGRSLRSTHWPLGSFVEPRFGSSFGLSSEYCPDFMVARLHLSAGCLFQVPCRISALLIPAATPILSAAVPCSGPILTCSIITWIASMYFSHMAGREEIR
jgi:hypothetical protein